LIWDEMIVAVSERGEGGPKTVISVIAIVFPSYFFPSRFAKACPVASTNS